MDIRVDPTDDRPLYLQIVDEVRRAVVTGVLRADEALPSVRALAGRLRVNPNTIKQAYRELEREGLAYAQQGRGTFVASDAVEPGAARDRLARTVAERAVRDAHRHGLTVGELLDAIRATAHPDREESGEHPEPPSDDLEAVRSPGDHGASGRG